jgi:RNA polymerase sigma-70 factor (ECF subfamily)
LSKRFLTADTLAAEAPNLHKTVAKENPYPDEELLNLLRTDSGKAMEMMFRAYYPFLCQTIVRVLPDAHVAEDLAQEVFFDIWKKRDSFSINTSLKAYLRRSGINRTLNYLRDRKIRWDDEEKIAYQPSNMADASRVLEGEDLQQKIDNTIESLPERCRLVFTLSRFEEMSYQEIADQLGISIKTVENQMTKALKILREAFEEELKGR